MLKLHKTFAHQANSRPNRICRVMMRTVRMSFKMDNSNGDFTWRPARNLRSDLERNSLNIFRNKKISHILCPVLSSPVGLTVFETPNPGGHASGLWDPCYLNSRVSYWRTPVEASILHVPFCHFLYCSSVALCHFYFCKVWTDTNGFVVEGPADPLRALRTQFCGIK